MNMRVFISSLPVAVPALLMVLCLAAAPASTLAQEATTGLRGVAPLDGNGEAPRISATEEAGRIEGEKRLREVRSGVLRATGVDVRTSRGRNTLRRQR